MKCPRCEKELKDGPVIIGLTLACPEPGCDGILLELSAEFTPEELEKFIEIVNRAVEDPEGFGVELLKGPEQIILDAGISRTTYDALQNTTFEMLADFDLPELQYPV